MRAHQETLQIKATLKSLNVEVPDSFVVVDETSWSLPPYCWNLVVLKTVGRKETSIVFFFRTCHFVCSSVTFLFNL